MRNRRGFKARLVLVVLLITVACAAQTNAQGPDRGFFDSIAQFTYNMAWPTATYVKWNFDSVREVPGGYDVVLLLDGRSGFDKSDLWLKLGVALRSNGIDNIWVVDHNAILVPPFKTMQALGQLTADLEKQYQQSQQAQAHPAPSQPPATAPGRAAAVCLSNETGNVLNIAYHWGNDSWSNKTIDADKTLVFWFPINNGDSTAPRFFVEYNNSFVNHDAWQSYELERDAVTLPANCNTAKVYVFTSSGSNILLSAAN